MLSAQTLKITSDISGEYSHPVILTFVHGSLAAKPLNSEKKRDFAQVTFTWQNVERFSQSKLS